MRARGPIPRPTGRLCDCRRHPIGQHDSDLYASACRRCRAARHNDAATGSMSRTCTRQERTLHPAYPPGRIAAIVRDHLAQHEFRRAAPGTPAFRRHAQRCQSQDLMAALIVSALHAQISAGTEKHQCFGAGATSNRNARQCDHQRADTAPAMAIRGR